MDTYVILYTLFSLVTWYHIVTVLWLILLLLCYFYNQSDVNRWVEWWQANATEPALGDFIAASYYDATIALALALNHTQTRMEELGMNKTIADFTYQDREMSDMITEGFKKVAFQGIKGFTHFNQHGNMEADAIIHQQKGNDL